MKKTYVLKTAENQVVKSWNGKIEGGKLHIEVELEDVRQAIVPKAGKVYYCRDTRGVDWLYLKDGNKKATSYSVAVKMDIDPRVFVNGFLVEEGKYLELRLATENEMKLLEKKLMKQLDFQIKFHRFISTIL